MTWLLPLSNPVHYDPDEYTQGVTLFKVHHRDFLSLKMSFDGPNKRFIKNLQASPNPAGSGKANTRLGDRSLLKNAD